MSSAPVFAHANNGRHVLPHPNKNKSRAAAQLLSSLLSGACKFLFLIPEPSPASCTALGKSLQLPLHSLPLQQTRRYLRPRDFASSKRPVFTALQGPSISCDTDTRLVYLLLHRQSRPQQRNTAQGHRKRETKTKKKRGRGVEGGKQTGQLCPISSVFPPG